MYVMTETSISLNIKIHYIKNIGMLGTKFIENYPDIIGQLTPLLHHNNWRIRITVCRTLQYFQEFSIPALKDLEYELTRSLIPTNLVIFTIISTGKYGIARCREYIDDPKMSLRVFLEVINRQKPRL